VALTLLSFLIDLNVGDRLLIFLLRSQDKAQAHGIVRVAKAIALLVTFYANVILLLTNCLLAFAIFPIIYGPWVFIIFYVMGDLLILQTVWLSQYEAIHITDKLPIFELPRGKVIYTEPWLRWLQVAFNLFTLAYFFVGCWLSSSCSC
jgi:hypothetical protein